VIVVVADPGASKYWLEDISTAAENMLLTIAALGYAGTWFERTIMPKEAELKEYFGVPEHLRFMIALPIGRAASGGSQVVKKCTGRSQGLLPGEPKLCLQTDTNRYKSE
jgi:nitroreductase